MSAKNRPITTPPKKVEVVSDYLFTPKIRMRQRGSPRYGTKTKRQRSLRERSFQRELKAIRSAAAPPLPKESKLPTPYILGGRVKRKTLLEQIKERLGGKP
jgi:hypothetical protein